jgi:predicted ATPase
VPPTLQASLLARLDRLGQAAKEAAQAAAAIGRDFPHDLLAAVAGLPEPALREAVSRLVASGLVHARGIPPDASYSFKHALVRDAAYGMLLRGRRRDLHARIGRELERRRDEAAGARPEVLARHFAEAGLAAKRSATG